VETRANHFLVGLFVLALMGALTFVGLWFARANLGEEQSVYHTYFRGSVTGLSIGSTVRYRGVPVGTVADIAIEPDNIERIRVTLALRPGTPIKTDTIAALQPQGITGLSFVELTGGTQAAPALAALPGRRVPEIPSRPSPIERLLADAPEAMARVGVLVERVSGLLNDENLRNIDRLIDGAADSIVLLARTLVHVEKLAEEAGGTLRGVDRTVADAGRLVADARGALDRVSAQTQSLIGDARAIANDARPLTPQAQAAIGDLRRTLGGFGQVADELQKLIATTRPGLQDFGQQGVYDLQQFMIEGRTLMVTLNRVLSNFERDPARFMFGDQTRGVEAR
jgi:phospholipid/cholesterol/gamma-HCH transport system substrate-binding protein